MTARYTFQTDPATGRREEQLASFNSGQQHQPKGQPQQPAVPFASLKEGLEAVRDERYRTDRAYREAVDRRLKAQGASR